jgi:pimeloyl-ACP methyl ester carboxylesterase
MRVDTMMTYPAKTHAGDRTSGASQHTLSSHVVVLIHGIRTTAEWQNQIRDSLERNGFDVVTTRYGYFDLCRFLVPVPWFRRTALGRLSDLIRDTRRLYPKAKISLIAHSFGTYLVAELLRHEFDFIAHRIIFCGTVISYKFKFEEVSSRFTPPIINECGTHDYWPVLAESITWGYGSSGTYGFGGPRVRDRWHSGKRHSDFLNEKFCSDFWIPFLDHGTIVPGDNNNKKPLYIWALHVFRLKYLLTIALFVVMICSYAGIATNDYRIYASGELGPTVRVGYAGPTLQGIVRRLQDHCTPSWLLECCRGPRCVQVERVDSDALGRLVVREDFRCDSCYAIEALERFEDRFRPCLRLSWHDTGRRKLSLGVNPSAVSELAIQGQDAAGLLLCNAAQN